MLQLKGNVIAKAKRRKNDVQQNKTLVQRSADLIEDRKGSSDQQEDRQVREVRSPTSRAHATKRMTSEYHPELI